jgi:hypothetical protein
MQIEGITWHGLTLEPDQFSAMKKLCREIFGLTPMIEQDGWTLFRCRTEPCSTSLSRTQS